MERQSTGFQHPQIDSILQKAIGTCPEVVIRMSNIDARCLLDTGAEVSTITESFYKTHQKDKVEQLIDLYPFINVSAANGQSISFKGYIEIDICVLGRVFPQMGFLVVNDLTNPPMSLRKRHLSE